MVRSKDDGDEGDQKMLVRMMTTMRSIKRSVRSKDDKGRVTLPKRMIFWKSSKGEEGEGGGVSIQKFMLQILDLETGFFSDVNRDKSA